MENIKEYIYVLDYSDCAIYEIVRDTDDDTDIEDVLKKYGCNVNTCSWMISDNRIESIITLNNY